MAAVELEGPAHHRLRECERLSVSDIPVCGGADGDASMCTDLARRESQDPPAPSEAEAASISARASMCSWGGQLPEDLAESDATGELPGRFATRADSTASNFVFVKDLPARAQHASMPPLTEVCTPTVGADSIPSPDARTARPTLALDQTDTPPCVLESGLDPHDDDYVSALTSCATSCAGSRPVSYRSSEFSMSATSSLYSSRPVSLISESLPRSRPMSFRASEISFLTNRSARPSDLVTPCDAPCESNFDTASLRTVMCPTPDGDNPASMSGKQGVATATVHLAVTEADQPAPAKSIFDEPTSNPASNTTSGRATPVSPRPGAESPSARMSPALAQRMAGLRPSDSPRARQASVRAPSPIGAMQDRLRKLAAAKTIGDVLSEAEAAAAEVHGGKIVVYTSSMTAVKATANACLLVRRTLQGHRVTFEERDVFMSAAFHDELQARCPGRGVPQIFLDGKHIGGATEIGDLNDSGELTQMLAHVPRVRDRTSGLCGQCGGKGFFPCTWCGGDRLSMFATMGSGETVRLRCTCCNENGLVRCTACLDA
eukprot:m.108659 g.108659  ORF g.108659 m.108659 type:complete len:547 (-) comp9012_c0_seq1:2096-3736(-)